MIEKIIRSPFTQLVGIGILMSWFYVLSKPLPSYELPVLLCLVLYFVLFISLMLFHNKRNPGRKVRIFSIIPYELLEDDEGQQWVTNRATRKVYVMFCFAIPILGALMVSFPYFPEVPLILLFVLSVIQYTIMWLETKRYLD
ncbi:hypothetical protein [Alkalicoccobacillus murimartini]|uniref:MFS transporter n=1 Tax=Alkalicoccobacillus murimartini TaxID=171685 RepID=A0ABT9YH42_9BACI|nr:hypothetical protein [Alkalicoccobacillus murimartini]MDQ0206836.1 hypothetical protein [Alkalicoccobacillus murimartini]